MEGGRDRVAVSGEEEEVVVVLGRHWRRWRGYGLWSS